MRGQAEQADAGERDGGMEDTRLAAEAGRAGGGMGHGKKERRAGERGDERLGRAVEYSEEGEGYGRSGEVRVGGRGIGGVVETVESGGSVQEAGRSLGPEADGHRDAGHGAGCMALGLACGYGGDHRSHRTEGGGKDEAGGDSEVAQFDDGREPRPASRVSSCCRQVAPVVSGGVAVASAGEATEKDVGHEI